jgi:Rha family phage regulatory protein
MQDLTLIRQDGGCYIDSREVAKLIGKQHGHLMRDIAGYVTIMRKINQSNFGVVDFFLENSYLDGKGETRPCYLLSKMGCEMVANKLTGEKGVLFTAAYVAKFNEMEEMERALRDAMEREQLASPVPDAKQHIPRLGEINACVRIVIRGMKNFGASPEWVMKFLADAYAPFGIAIDPSPLDKDAPRWYTAKQIAAKCGVYSLYGKPHSQAVACILNEYLEIGEEHKRVDAEVYGCFTGVSVRYDSTALRDVVNWLIENGLPDAIHGFDKTYRVTYMSV